MASGIASKDLAALVGREAAARIDAEVRPALIWTADASELMWASASSASFFGQTDSGGNLSFSPANPGLARLKALARDLKAATPSRSDLRFFVRGRLESVATTLLPFTTCDGAAALLTVFGDGPEINLPAIPRNPVDAPPAKPGPATEAMTAADLPEAVVAQPGEPAPAPVPPPSTRPVRFVFLTDGDGHLVTLSQSFRQATGHDGAPLIGQSLVDVLADIDPARAAEVARAMFARQTWSGIALDWPSPDGSAARQVELSAMPVFGADRQVTGYNGFGISRARLMSSVAAVAPVAAAVAAAAAPVAAVLPADAAAVAPAAVEVTQAAEAATDAEPDDEDEEDEEAPEPEEAAGTVPASTPEVAETQASAEADDEDSETAEPADEAPAAEAPEPVSAPEATAAAAAPATPEETRHAPEPAATTGPARQDNVPPPEPTVVPLRTVRGHVAASLGEPNIVPLKPAGGAEQSLSPSERNAFREIARALGARLEEDRPAEQPAAAVLPVVGDAARTTPAQTAADEQANKVAAAQAEISKALAAAHARKATDSDAAAAPAPSPAALGDILVERIPVGVLVFRGDKTIYMNRPLLDLLGYVDVAEFEALRGLDKLFRGRAAPSFSNGEYDTITIMGRDGETLPADAHLQAIDWNGQHATLVTFRRALDAEHGPRVRSLDVELKARQAELAEARAMLDTATDGVISLDENGRILALNKSAEALFGYDQNELTGERLTLLLAPESHAAALDYIDGLKNGGVASVLNDGREVIGRERKGGRIPLFMTIGRISDTSKLAAVVRDLTAWKRAESELTEARRAAERNSALKSDFLAKVSHEIRTPMNAIIGFAEVMRDERLGPIGTERYKDYLKDIHTSGTHVISLVNDLLDLSKIEAGRMELNFASVDLNAIVSSCLGIMQPQANRDRVLMRSQLSAKLPPVVADERSIRQIVLNLLSNASKFTEAGGQVIISTVLSEQGEAIIRVRDTGVGMTEPEVQAAMEPFRQLSNARGRGGTGLGLPLTKALVEANRASFSIKSKVREGTLVEIVFPPTRVLAE